MTIRRTRQIAVVLGSVVGALILSACSGAGGDEAEEGVVRFGVGDPQLQVGTAPYTSTPEKMGYWKDHGLEVEVQGTEGAVASVQGLLTGNFDIVNGGSTAFYQAAATDPRIKIISLGAANIWKTAVPPDSSIKSIEDLKGATIGAQSRSSASYLFGRAALAAAGLDPDEDVEWLMVGVGAQAAHALEDGTVDAYASYDGPLGVVAQLYGEQLRALPSGLDDLTGTLGLATTTDYYKENRDTVIEFLEAFNEGKMFAHQNPEAAIQMHWEQFTDQKPKGMAVDEAVKETLPIVTDRWAADAAPGTGGLVGYLDQSELENSVDFFQEYGLLEGDVDVQETSGMDVAKKAAESFDEQKAKQDAAKWRAGS